MSESRGLSALQVVQRKKEKRRANNKRLKKFQLLSAELIQDAHGNGGIIVFLSTATRFQILWFAKVLRKSKLSEPSTHMRSLYKNTSITTKNKSYFIN